MTTAYKAVRLPYDVAKGSLKLAMTPIHIGKTVAMNIADTAFKIVGTSTEDVPTPITNGGKGENIYDLTKYNLDIATMIYYYTEIRSEIKKLVKELAKKKGMSTDCSDPGYPSDLMILRNAIEMVERAKAAIEIPEPTSSTKALKEYQISLEQLNNLSAQLKLDKGDLEVFKTYFDIMKKRKDLLDVKSDLIRYDKFIDPQFRLGFGGSEWNRSIISSMIDTDKDMYIHYIDDDFTTSSMDLDQLAYGLKTELTWAIVVSKAEKKVTVSFRGSVNIMDWKTDLSVSMKDCVLPGFTSKNSKGSGKTFGKVHVGFYNYLFNETKAGANGSTKSKGEEIVGMLKGDFFDKPEYSDYSLEITGHSLGGALSTLFAFRCAAFDDFPNTMVKNISFASPFVGNEDFRQFFVDAERKRKIEHLRISNYQDMVTLVPNLALPSLETYKHVGMNIRLYEGGDPLAPGYRRFYPKQGGAVLNNIRNTLHSSLLVGLSVGIIGKHLCPEYQKRLEYEDTAEELKKLTVSELYANKDITGWEYL